MELKDAWAGLTQLIDKSLDAGIIKSLNDAAGLVMAMEVIAKQLGTVSEMETRVANLESQLAGGNELAEETEDGNA